MWHQQTPEDQEGVDALRQTEATARELRRAEDAHRAARMRLLLALDLRPGRQTGGAA